MLLLFGMLLAPLIAAVYRPLQLVEEPSRTILHHIAQLTTPLSDLELHARGARMLSAASCPVLLQHTCSTASSLLWNSEKPSA
jgi:hypothetical protein